MKGTFYSIKYLSMYFCDCLGSFTESIFKFSLDKLQKPHSSASSCTSSLCLHTRVVITPLVPKDKNNDTP